jgi:hypothetical protein
MFIENWPNCGFQFHVRYANKIKHVSILFMSTMLVILGENVQHSIVLIYCPKMAALLIDRQKMQKNLICNLKPLN